VPLAMQLKDTLGQGWRQFAQPPAAVAGDSGSSHEGSDSTSGHEHAASTGSSGGSRRAHRHPLVGFDVGLLQIDALEQASVAFDAEKARGEIDLRRLTARVTAEVLRQGRFAVLADDLKRGIALNIRDFLSVAAQRCSGALIQLLA